MTLNTDYLRSLLERKRWSERQLAMKAGLSQATVSRLLTNKRGPGLKAMLAITRVFNNIPMDNFFI